MTCILYPQPWYKVCTLQDKVNMQVCIHMIVVCYSYVSRACMYPCVPVCTRLYTYVPVCTLINPNVVVCTRMYPFVFVCSRVYLFVLVFSRMYPVCIRVLLVRHSLYPCVLVCTRIFPYVPRMYSCVTRTSLVVPVCTRLYSYFPICTPYVFVCYSYVTRGTWLCSH